MRTVREAFAAASPPACRGATAVALTSSLRNHVVLPTAMAM